MTTTTTGYLGLVLAVPATKEPFNTGIYNQNLTKLENRLQSVDGVAGSAQATASSALSAANNAQGSANTAQGTANDAVNRANTAQGRADDAWNRTTDLYNRMSATEGVANSAYNRTSDIYSRLGFTQSGRYAGTITPSAVNANTSVHINWSFNGKPVAVVTPETGSPASVRMTLTNISASGCDVVINRSDNTSATGYNVLAFY